MKLKDRLFASGGNSFQPPNDCDGMLYTARSVGCSILGRRSIKFNQTGNIAVRWGGHCRYANKKRPIQPPLAHRKILISCPKADQIHISSSEPRKNGTLIDRESQTDSQQDFRSSRRSLIVNSRKSALMRDLNSKISVGSDGTKDKEKFEIRVGASNYLMSGLSDLLAKLNFRTFHQSGMVPNIEIAHEKITKVVAEGSAQRLFLPDPNPSLASIIRP